MQLDVIFYATENTQTKCSQSLPNTLVLCPNPVMYPYASVVRELVKRNKMVINDEDEDSNTALHLAALAGHNKVVLALIEAGADIEARYASCINR